MAQETAPAAEPVVTITITRSMFEQSLQSRGGQDVTMTDEQWAEIVSDIDGTLETQIFDPDGLLDSKAVDFLEELERG